MACINHWLVIVLNSLWRTIECPYLSTKGPCRLGLWFWIHENHAFSNFAFIGKPLFSKLAQINSKGAHLSRDDLSYRNFLAMNSLNFNLSKVSIRSRAKKQLLSDWDSTFHHHSMENQLTLLIKCFNNLKLSTLCLVDVPLITWINREQIQEVSEEIKTLSSLIWNLKHGAYFLLCHSTAKSHILFSVNGYWYFLWNSFNQII